MYRHLRFLAFLIGFLLLFTTAGAQEQPSTQEPPVINCNHGGYGLWDALRVLPVHFIRFKSNAVIWKYQDEYTIKLGAFMVSEDSRYFSRDMRGVSEADITDLGSAVWLCYYCSRCQTLLIAYEMKPGASPIQ